MAVAQADPCSSIGSGASNTCGMEAGTSQLHCFGSDYEGRSTPPSSVSAWTSFSVGSHHICGIEADTGKMYCFGSSNNQRSAVPANVAAWTALSAGDDHTCGIEAGTNALHCFGDCRDGSCSPPSSVAAWSAVSAGTWFNCALETGTMAIHCFGQNGDGQSTPPSNVAAWSSISAGRHHVCGIEAGTNAMHCFGRNSDGQCTPPASVAAWAAVNGGDYHTCGIELGTNALHCFGKNSNGQCSPPSSVAAWVDVSAGRDHTCGIEAGTGKLYCFGSDSSGKSTPTSSVQAWGGVDCDVQSSLTPAFLDADSSALDLKSTGVLPSDSSLGSSAAWLGGHAIITGMPGTESLLLLGMANASKSKSNLTVLGLLQGGKRGLEASAVESGSRFGAAVAWMGSYGPNPLHCHDTSDTIQPQSYGSTPSSTTDVLIGSPSARNGKGSVHIVRFDSSTCWLLPSASYGHVEVYPGVNGLPVPGQAGLDTGFGTAVAWLGSLDGRFGTTDVAVSSKGDRDGTGAVSVMRVNLTSFSIIQSHLITVPDTIGFGSALAWLGDVRGEGFARVLAVGAHAKTPQGSSSSSSETEPSPQCQRCRSLFAVSLSRDGAAETVSELAVPAGNVTSLAWAGRHTGIPGFLAAGHALAVGMSTTQHQSHTGVIRLVYLSAFLQTIARTTVELRHLAPIPGLGASLAWLPPTGGMEQYTNGSSTWLVAGARGNVTSLLIQHPVIHLQPRPVKDVNQCDAVLRAEAEADLGSMITPRIHGSGLAVPETFPPLTQMEVLGLPLGLECNLQSTLNDTSSCQGLRLYGTGYQVRYRLGNEAAGNNCSVPGAVGSFGWKAPVLSGVRVVGATFLSQGGGTVLELTGEQLYPSAIASSSLWPGLIRAGPYACHSLVQSADGSTLRCTVPAGVGGPHVITVNEPVARTITSPDDAAVQFEAGTITSITPSHVVPRLGSVQSFEISGSLLGNQHSDISSASVGGLTCDPLVRHNSSHLTCTTPSSGFDSSDVVVELGTPPLLCVGGSNVFSFPPNPIVVGVVPSIIPTSTPTNVTMFGSALSQSPIAAVGVGSRACVEIEVQSDFMMRCLAPPGVGTGHHAYVVTEGGIRTTSQFPLLQYSPPTVASIRPSFAFSDPAVANPFNISGSNFGSRNVTSSAASSVVATVGGVLCPDVVHVSDSLLICVGVSAPWSGTAVEVTVAGQSGRAADAFSFQPPPSVTDVSPSLGPTAGGTELTIEGDGFGASVEGIEGVRVGNGSCTDVVFVSATEMRCRSPPGIGRDLQVSVTTRDNGASEPLEGAFSYNRPIIVSVARIPTAPEPGPVADIAADPSMVVYAGEAGVDLEINVTHGGTELSGWAPLPRVSTTDWTSSCQGLRVRHRLASGEIRSVRCRNVSFVDAPAASPFDAVASVTVGGQLSSAEDSVDGAVSVLAAPVVSAVSPSTVPTGGSKAAGGPPSGLVQLLGSGFGTSPASITRVTVGGVACSEVQWISTSELRVAVPPGVGAPAAIVVTNAGGVQSSPAKLLSYQAAEVLVLEPSYSMTGKGLRSSFSITGTNFGNSGADLDGVLVGGQPCRPAEWMSPTAIACHGVNASQWMSRSVTVTVGGQQGLKNSYFEPVPAPAITVVSPQLLSQGEGLLILGEGFGYSQADVRSVTVAGVECEGVKHRGFTAVSCTMPAPPAALASAAAEDPSVLANLPVVITTSGGLASAVTSASRVSYTGSGSSITAAPMHVTAFRPVGASEIMQLRWTYVPDRLDDDVAAVESFEVEMAVVEAEDGENGAGAGSNASSAGGSGPSSQVSQVDIGRVDEVMALSDGELKASEGGTMLYRHALFTFTSFPLRVRVRAVNPTGAGPWSEAVTPVPETCAKDEYLGSNLAVDEWACGACPAGSFCGGQPADNATATDGHWRVFWRGNGLAFVPCPNPTACQGYKPRASRPNSTTSTNPTSSLGSVDQAAAASLGLTTTSELQRLAQSLALDQQPSAVPLYQVGMPVVEERCAEGYTGTLCASCAPGYTLWGNKECRKCSDGVAIGLGVGGMSLLLFVVVAALTLNAVKGGLKEKPGTVKVGVTALKLVFSHIQTVSIASSLDLQWPDSVVALFAGMQTVTSVSSDVLSLDCMLGSSSEVGEGAPLGSLFFSRSIVMLALPVIMFAAAVVFWSLGPVRRWALGRLRRVCCCCQEDDDSIPAAKASQSGMQLASWGSGRPSVMVPSPMRLAALGPSHSHGRGKSGASKSAGSMSNPISGGLSSLQSVTSQARESAAHRGGGMKRKASMYDRVRRRVSLSSRSLGMDLSMWDKVLVTCIVIAFGVHMTASKAALLLLTCTDVDTHVASTATITVPSGDGIGAETGTSWRPVAAASGQRLPAGCPEDDPGRRLLMDHEVCCGNPEAQALMFGLGIPGVLVYAMGIPVAMGLVLYWRRDDMDNPRNRATLGFLTAGMKREHQYWEAVIMLRKVLIAAVAVFLAPQGAAIQTYTALLVVFALTVVHVLAQPFATRVLNNLELCALVTAFMTFECGLFITSPAVPQFGKGLATVAIFVMNAGFLLFAAGAVCRHKWKRMRASKSAIGSKM